MKDETINFCISMPYALLLGWVEKIENRNCGNNFWPKYGGNYVVTKTSITLFLNKAYFCIA